MYLRRVAPFSSRVPFAARMQKSSPSGPHLVQVAAVQHTRHRAAARYGPAATATGENCPVTRVVGVPPVSGASLTVATRSLLLTNPRTADYRTPVRLRQLLRLATLCSGESNAPQPAEPVARSRSCAGEPGGRAVDLTAGLLLSSGRRPPRAGRAGRWRWRAGCCRPGWPPRSCRHRCWPSTGGWHPPPPRSGCAGQ
jgi:hypothetical protein